MSASAARSLVLLVCLAACSTPQPAAPSPQLPASPSVAATASLPPGALRFAAVPSRSVATIRVREQVAGVALPGEAVLTTSAFSGALVLLRDGSFAPSSQLAVDLDTLKSDSDLRDEWIKFNTLNTRVYPRAEFTAARVTGIPLPLPDTGEWTALLEGTLKIHGVERPLTWELRTTRSAGEIRVKGMTAFHFGDYGMAVPANRLVLSVVDDVRLEIDVVAATAR